jgi:hypothetical protein
MLRISIWALFTPTVAGCKIGEKAGNRKRNTRWMLSWRPPIGSYCGLHLAVLVAFNRNSLATGGFPYSVMLSKTKVNSISLPWAFPTKMSFGSPPASSPDA